MTDGPTPRISYKTALVLHPDDDVAVLVASVARGEAVITQGAREGVVLLPSADLSSGQKIAMRSMAMGSQVHKYGEIIGRLTAAVAAGDHVHVHNLVSLRAVDQPRKHAESGEI